MVNINKQDLYWLAGLLEGEGSFMKGAPSAPNLPRITIVMTDEDVICKVAQLFGVGYCPAGRKRKAHWKDAYRTAKRGRDAASLMRELLPLMGKRRKAQIGYALDSYNPGLSKIKLTKAMIKEIRKMCSLKINQSVVAKKFNVTREHICRIYNNRNWKNLY